MIKVCISFEGDEAGVAGAALSPDNPDWIGMTLYGGKLFFELSAERAGSILATIDDLLMNAKVAEETYGLGG